MILNVGTLQAQLDVVVVKRKRDEGTINRKGAIVEWAGLSLTLSSNGRESEIDNEEIVDVQTKWNPDYLTGLSERNAGRTQVAIHRFQTALTTETRPWAQRIIRAKLVDAMMEVEKPAEAVQQFMRIRREDPQTRFAYLAPLPWTNTGSKLDRQAAEWMKLRDPMSQLIGASWMLGGPNNDVALKQLNELSSSIDPTIQALATAQMWRVRVGVNEKQVQVWLSILGQMPRESKAGPYFVLADAQARAGNVERALVNLMRIPINYSDQRSLAAAALYRTAGLLHNKGEEKKAQAILEELVKRHPHTIWAQQASQ